MHVLPPHPGLSPAARAACAAWFGPIPPEVGASPGTGFSGAPLVRVRPRGAADWFVLKAFTVGTSRARADWVHGLVRHLAAEGVTEVPRPCPTPSGDTVVTDPEGTHWELVPCVAGVATDAPTDAQAAAALATLARLHVAAARLPGATPRVGPSAGALMAVQWARAFRERPWSDRRAEVRVAADDDFRAAVAARWDRAISLLETPAGARVVGNVAGTNLPVVPLQAVLRDVWSAHVLFAPGASARVAGIVDVHAAAIDAPALDLGRLLGSWRRRDSAARAGPAPWAGALAAYEAVRPLAPVEHEVVSLVETAGVLVGLDAWFRWTLEERRRFPSAAAALARIDWLLTALPDALAALTGRGMRRV